MNLINRYFVRYNRIYKITDFLDQEFICFNVIGRNIIKYSFDTLESEAQFLPCRKYGDLDYLADSRFEAYVRDFYLHREDGPALVFKDFKEPSKGYKKFYLHGIELEPIVYLERLPEEIQRRLVFELDSWR